MYTRANLAGFSVFSCSGTLLLLAAWLTHPAGVLGQVVEQEEGEAVRYSAKLAQQEKVPELSEVARLVIERTNQFRKEQGLEKVQPNARLMKTAQGFAQYMAKNNRYGHTADGKRPADRARQHGYDYCLVSENIAYQYNSLGFETSGLAGLLVEGWKNSPEHRKNMLDPAATETGVSVAQSPETGYYYAVQMFGRPKSQSIEFEIENQSQAMIEYQIAGRAFSLPPGYTRTHQQCRPAEVAFRWPEGAKGQAATVQAANGDRFIVSQEAGALKVVKQ